MILTSATRQKRADMTVLRDGSRFEWTSC